MPIIYFHKAVGIIKSVNLFKSFIIWIDWKYKISLKTIL